MPLNEIGGTVDFGGIFTTGIDQVEILRGPNSVLYGADALSGVVNLTTSQGSTFTPQASYAFDAGNFNSLHNDLSFGGIFRQIDYFSEFARYDGGNTSSNPHFHNGTYAGNFGWSPGASTSLRLTVREWQPRLMFPMQLISLASLTILSRQKTIPTSARPCRTRPQHTGIIYCVTAQRGRTQNL